MMNGFQTNGDSHPADNNPVQDVKRIIEALQVSTSGTSTNESRRAAFEFLETVKADAAAPSFGFELASDRSYPDTVRHFGILCLEIAIKYRWQDYNEHQAAAVRRWVLQLTNGIAADDPLFIRNKIAQLWSEVAKRSWMLDWTDMDEQLTNIWQGGPVEKLFVMEVLENMAENSFGKEDSVAAIRGDDLTNYCLDIFTPAAVFREHFPNRDDLGCRYGDDGWLLRVVDFLSWCLGQDPKDRTVSICAIKATTLLKACLEWVMLKAVMVTQTPDRLCQALMSSNQSLVLEALQCLFLLFIRRPKFHIDDVEKLVVPMFNKENVEILRKIYVWSTVDPEDIDEERYLICKKLSPLLFQLGLFVDERPAEIFGWIDMDPYFDLLLEVVQSKSLHVSIPVMHLWALLMGNASIRRSPQVLGRVGDLLQICSQRLMRYEDMPEQSEPYSAELIFLHDDVDTPPERHQFLGNYARFAKDVIDGMVQQQPKDALEHILNQTSELMVHMYDEEPPFDAEDCTRYASRPALRLDAQASVIEAAVFGYAKWRSEQRVMNPNQEEIARQQAEIDAIIEQWVMRWMAQIYDDPALQQRLVIIFISIAVGPLRKNPQVVIQIFEFILKTKIEFLAKDRPPINEAMYDLQHEELQRFCSHQLQRLAIKSHDFLAAHHDSVENGVQEYISSLSLSDDDRERALAVPFIVLQRATALPEEQRRAKLASFVESRMAPWLDPKLDQALQSLDAFCQFTDLAGFQDQFLPRRALNFPDWSEVRLLGPGIEFKRGVDDTRRYIPIRITRTILGASVDRADTSSLEVARLIWGPHIPVILPKIVTLMKLSIQFSAPSVWRDAPQETQSLIRRIMRDRFWQVGISSGTRDEFYNKVTSTRETMEGLASAIRGCIRDIRETCFKILALLTYLGDVVYQFDELSQALCEAMFFDPMALSTHQTTVLLETARALIEQCPKERHQTFLPPFIAALFDYLDDKIGREWNVIDEKKGAGARDDDLTEEMKEESILRNLTFAAVLFVTRIFDPDPARHAPKKLEPGQEPGPSPQRLDVFVMENPQVFKSAILFGTHVLRYHDSRCCTYIVKVLRQIIPAFANVPDQFAPGDPNLPQLSPEICSEIREFISTDVFKACITSLHDPYFVDIQPDLAGLIARIITNYFRLTTTPRDILLSLPDMTAERVDHAIGQLDTIRESKKQKSIVLKLLAGLRGVSVAEQGRIARPIKEEIKQDPALNRYTRGNVETKDTKIKKEDDDDGALEAVADMFQGA